MGPTEGPALTHASAPSPPQASFPPNTSLPSPSSRASGTPGSPLRKAQCSWEGQPHHCQHFLCWDPAQLPSFLLQDPRVQEKEMPPPLSAGHGHPPGPRLTPDLRPTGSPGRASGCAEGQGAGRGPGPGGEGCPSPPARPGGAHTATWGALRGGRNDSGLPKEWAGRGGARAAPGLFMNVSAVGMCGPCVSVNECRCVTLRERPSGAARGGPDGAAKRPCVCVCVFVCARVCARVRERVCGWARLGHVRHYGNVRGVCARRSPCVCVQERGLRRCECRQWGSRPPGALQQDPGWQGRRPRTPHRPSPRH